MKMSTESALAINASRRANYRAFVALFRDVADPATHPNTRPAFRDEMKRVAEQIERQLQEKGL
jgi:hypothetical protein